MPTHITYLLGAGASAKAIPVVEKFKEEVQKCIDYLSIPAKVDGTKYEILNEETRRYFNSFHSRFEVLQIFEELLADLKVLNKVCDEQVSFDTYAKQLFHLKKWEEVKRLKLAIEMTLTFIQLYSDSDKSMKLDNRYTNFLAAILPHNKPDLLLPENLKILSWNYDWQFELALNEYTKINSLYELQQMLNTFGKNRYNSLEKGFALIKLNGTAGFTVDKSDEFYPLTTKFPARFEECFGDILVNHLNQKIYVENRRSNQFTGIYFAWEPTNFSPFPEARDIVEVATNSTKETQVLVIIGYSFPIFNRRVDSKILKSMTELKKVYIQDPYAAEQTKERFLGIRPDLINDIVLNKDKNQFVFPDEMTLE